MKILGIETACDDTSVAIVEDGHEILSNIIYTQEVVHKKFGGVVPELAARRHVEVISFAINDALESAKVTMDKIDAIAVNCKHGLIRSLVVGVAAAKALAFSRDLPLICVHHIEGHIYSNLILNQEMEFPFICLTVSGGHNLLLLVKDIGEYELIGRTLDDSAGEAFDKMSKLLELGFPGGPILEKLALQGDKCAYKFPRPMIDQNNFNFSFSGLKTAVFNKVSDLKKKSDVINKNDIAASFQQAVFDVLIDKTIKAAQNNDVFTIAVSGGVAANNTLRKQFLKLGEKHNFKIYFPEPKLCTDNGAMVAALGYHKYLKGELSDFSIDAEAFSPLGANRLLYK